MTRTGQEIKAQFQAAEAQDRANYEKMWRDEGKTPPPLPAYQSIPVENQN